MKNKIWINQRYFNDELHALKLAKKPIEPFVNNFFENILHGIFLKEQILQERQLKNEGGLFEWKN